MGTLLDCEGNGGVAKVVKPKRLGEARCLDRGEPDTSAEVGAPEDRTVRRGEGQTGTSGNVGGHGVAKESGE
jgi:hypothetical protein